MNETDPIIVWPENAQLAPIIAAMQRLNPTLNLRCATKYVPAREERYRTGNSGQILTRTVEAYTLEYLVYDGTAADVLTIAMPDPPTDEMMSGLSEVNREGGTRRTDIGTFQVGPRRIERTAEGNLRIRPYAQNASAAISRFNLAWQGFFDENQDGMVGGMGRIVRQWGIFREQHEQWEVDMGYLPDYFAVKYDDKNKRIARDPRRPQNDHDYWHTTPVGTVSYIDRYDLPIEEHYARARAILSAGSEFSIVGDVERGEVRVFRLSGVEVHTEDFRMPEMPWFKVPVGRVQESVSE